MAAAALADSKRMYSWWWDSHISPKNSKWLQENLTDMDAKVKQMIKLIEEDADSFARRAEMYYKKRPELMKMVEEFYRAYRALAERYDNATGVLRQAHQTMAETFPNQVPLVMADDSPAGSATEADPHTPEMPPPIRALFNPDELQKDALGLSPSHFPAVKRNGAFTNDSDSVTIRKGLKQPNDLFGSGEAVNHAKFAEGRVRKGLNFHDAEEKERSEQSKESHDLKARILSESERVSKTEMEILSLKKALAKLEAEKEAGLLQYQQSLERLSNLESQVSCAQDDSKGLNERASKAEAEVLTLKEALTKLEVEREASLLQYQQCLDKISDLENNISNSQKVAGELDEQARKAEIEAEALKQDLARVEAEKEAVHAQYKQCLDMVLNLKEQLQHAEEVARKISERADKAESEVESLKQALGRVTEEKEAAAVQYQQCLETISSLEHKLSCAEEEAQRLNSEIDNGVAKLKGAEERCLLLEKSNQTLQSELESSLQTMGTQSEELTEKQKELGRLWTCVQEERLRFIEAETAFQTLQHLHSQSQEELRSMAAELQNRAQILKDMETHNQGLQDEVQKVKEDNKGLNELNLSSAMSMKNLQDEILTLRETIRKLEQEVELRMDQRNALQQEIYCLKEELNDLSKKYQAMQEQVDSVGLDPECFGSSVKELQDGNTKLKEICERERSEKVALSEKLEIMEKLLEKNALLENSLADLNVELEGVRGTVKALEESCQSLLGDKSTLAAEKANLISQLQLTTENLEKLLETNNFLENSLADANAELEGLRVKSKGLEDSCLLLDKEKSGLISERESLVFQLDITQQRLEDLEKKYTELEEKLSCLEKERQCTLREVEELQVSLDAEKQEHASFVHLSEARLAGLELQICFLQDECQCRKREYEEELDKAVNTQIENFILQKCVQDLEEKSFSLLIEYEKVLEASKLSEKRISELEHENLEQQMEVKSLFDQISILRMGLYQVLKTLDNDADQGCECKDKIEQDQTLLNHICGRIQETQNSLFEIWDENQQLVIEKSVLVTLLGQLKLEATNLVTERNILDQEFSIQSEQFSLLQIETQKLIEMNEELRLKAMEGNHKEEVLMTEIENLHGQLLHLQEAYQNLLEENRKVIEEKRSLMMEVLDLGKVKRNLEEENCVVFSEAICQSNLSLIFKDIIAEKSVELKELSENFNKLQFVNNDLVEKVKIMEGKLEDEIASGKDLLCQKENELLEAKQMLTAMQNAKTELHKRVEDLKCKYDEVNLIREDQGKKILKLSGDFDHQSKESECLREANLKIDAELGKLCAELEETKRREESLSYELQKGRNEVELWETQASTFFGELQISAVREALFEGKMHELSEACESFEDRSNSKVTEIGLLKETVSTLEGENGGLKAQLAAYTPVVISLRDCIASLENHTLLHTKPHKASDEAKDVTSVSHLHAVSCQQMSEDQIAMVPGEFSDLQDLQTRIKAIEKTVMETERLAILENLNANAKLEAAMRQVKELKSGSSLRQENVQTSKHLSTPKRVDDEIGDGLSNDLKQQKQRPEISEDANEVLPKDIMLDHISESSSYGISRRDNANDQMLELWETTDQDGSIDLTVGKAQKVTIEPYQQTEAVKQHKSANPSSESVLVKELGVDKLEISNRFTEPREEGNKRKILERLDSDAQKLTNLQITVQDLKRKVEITEKSKKGKGIEYDTVKEQLEEAEEATVKLFDVNRKLMKNVEDGSLSSDGKSAIESDESGSARRRRVSEQARRGSEKIGRLQLEVQKLQFLLLKLDDEKESRGRTKFTERKTRVLLRDYLYGGPRTSQKRKKAPFCGCVQPPTKGD